MIRFRRLTVVGAVLGLTAALTYAPVRGGPDARPRVKPILNGSKTAPDATAEDLAKCKFSDGGVVTYRTQDGDILFALPVKPRLDPQPARPCDYLIMVDTSASQVGVPLFMAQQIAEQLITQADAQDRVSLWTINIPKEPATQCLTHGFKGPKDEAVQDAVKKLHSEVPLGDTDLKYGLQQALRSFGKEPDRQRVLVFLGDGMSVHDPLTPAERSQLADDMVTQQVAFFPVPLGPRLDPYNLHGLASGTGGLVVRVLTGDKVGMTVKRLRQAVAAPILYPATFQLPADQVAEFVPTKMPPLRTDAPTLVLGRLKAGKKLTYTVTGTVAGREVRVQQTEAVVDPELDNFFLVGMYEQWKNAKDQPAIMQADRALAFAQELNQMARAELLAEGEMALGKFELDAAKKLFDRAHNLDPNDVEAAGGLKLVRLLQSGQLSKDKFKELNTRQGEGLLMRKTADGKLEVRKDAMKNLVAQAEAGEPLPPPTPRPLAPANDQNNPLREQQLRMAVADQRATGIVDTRLQQARRLLQTDPQGASDLLQQAQAAIQDDIDLSDRTREVLLRRLADGLRYVEQQGAIVQRNREERLRRIAIARDEINREAQAGALQERTQERMRVFHSLMNQARYLDAYRQALAITQDAINSGNPVPIAVTAGYNIGLVSTNLSELRELRRRREERYLLTMMQVERSAVPFPDEPPVEFPPAPIWRELTRVRKERYESSGLTDEDPVVLQKVKDLKDKLAQYVKFDEFNGPLKDALGYLSDLYGITILIDTEAFKSDPQLNIEDPGSVQVKLPKMTNVSLATVLRLLLSQVPATYMIRRDYVEVTTGARQAAEKVLRVYPVADLVIPIPNAVNNQQLQQNFQLFGQSVTVGGAAGALGALGAGLGAVGALGALGGALGLGALGALGALGGVGALGALGGAGALGIAGQAGALGLGAAGGGLQGAGGGFGGAGMGFQGGMANQGFGGGFAGFGGGQLGQFGNLGGQFGIQGGDQSTMLIQLIKQVVGDPDDWAPTPQFQQPGGNIGADDDTDQDDTGQRKRASQLGYYPAARALMVKATSRIHTSLGGMLAPRGAAAVNKEESRLDPNNPDVIVIAPHRDHHMRVAGAGDYRGDLTKKKPKKPRTAVVDLDAHKVWQEAMAKDGVRDPGLIIAAADYLALHGPRFDHAAELLKANLRRGIVAQPWVYEALAIALKESNGSLVDVERAELSAVDLQPQDAGSYLQASKAMAELKRYDRALAYCRQASLLEPNAPTPYAEALLYAELGKDTTAMQWAAGNLLKRDWPKDNDKLHTKALVKLKGLARSLDSGGRKQEAEAMLAAVEKEKDRDLVIHLTWQGDASLKLEVTEPIGTVCSALHRQAPGGGTLLGERIGDYSGATYVAAKAFPGLYRVKVRRAWGSPLGSKATLEIIEHQGTPEETLRRETIVLDNEGTVSVSLDQGRRTSTAKVSPETPKPSQGDGTDELESGSSILAQMRSLANPSLGYPSSGITGGVTSRGIPIDTERMTEPPEMNSMDSQVAYQAKVSPFVSNSLDLTAQATVSADRRYVRLSLSPVFQTANNVQPTAVLNNPIIPGGFRP